MKLLNKYWVLLVGELFSYSYLETVKSHNGRIPIVFSLFYLIFKIKNEKIYIYIYIDNMNINKNIELYSLILNRIK